MKRLVFCFDGTWNRVDAPNPTNVVLTAQSVSPVARDRDGRETIQIIHYDQGVGTTRETRWGGGLFGEGLLDHLTDAYTFLAMNYDVGDDIFVFGFSRGAFTARSFVGFLRTVGVLRRCDAGRIGEAVKAYQARDPRLGPDTPELLGLRMRLSPDVCVDEKDDDWRCQKLAGYVRGASPRLQIRFVGVWDTVGSLGVPDSLLFAPFVNRKYRFYDTDISTLVASARHAVAIDEQRRSFAPTLWSTLDALNRSCGYEPEDDRAPYQQKWFPGVHGSVGGGGDYRGLSDFALQWIIDGARHAGLQLDVGADSRIFGLAPEPKAPLDNVKGGSGGLLGALMAALPKAPRSPGPSRVQDVSASAQARWNCEADELPEKARYRPRTLAGVADALEALRKGQTPPAAPPPAPTTTAPMPGDYYRIVRGDTLTAIAQKAYGAASMFKLIVDANPGLLGDADHIYENQLIFIPPPSPAPAEATTEARPSG
jgi:uncharacterized protein (DUF2235 family)/phage tail protein X